jgi:ABC-type iron transport system FetAB permease component|tara:strand:- start:61 stop:276 length:216 start_codon:yes stop_codon:yes gene_type:complete
MSDIVRKKLEEARKALQQAEKEANRPVKKEAETVNLCPPIPELPPAGFEKDVDIPGVITGGKKGNNKWREV